MRDHAAGGARAAATLGVLLAGGVACADADTAGVTPAAISTIAAEAANATVAVDARSGQSHVVWIEKVDDAYQLFHRRAGDDSQPVRVNDISGDVAPHEQAPPQVAVGPEGNIYVVWQNNTPAEGRRFPTSDLRLARSLDGGRTFEPAIHVNDDAGGVPSSHTFHDVAVADDGTVLVSWIDSRARDIARQAAADTSTAEPHPGHHTHGEAEQPPQEIRVARSRDGGASFEPSVVVDTAPCPCCRTAMAIGGDGDIYLSWRKLFPGDVRDIVVVHADLDRLEFTEPVRVHPDGWSFPACPHAGPGMVVDDAGTLHVAWYTGREGRQGLWYATSSDAARSFSPATPLLVDEWVPPSQARLGLSDGRILVAWEDRRDAEHRIAVAEIRDGKIATHSLLNANGSQPSLTASGDSWAAVWLDDGAVRLSLSSPSAANLPASLPAPP